jgi:hypothetical protein
MKRKFAVIIPIKIAAVISTKTVKINAVNKIMRYD